VLQDFGIEDLVRPARAVCVVDADLEVLETAMQAAPDLVVALVENERSMRLAAEVHAFDLQHSLQTWGLEAYELRASDLARPAASCELHDTREASLAIMRAFGRSVLHVVDREGRLLGSICIEDISASGERAARALA
jgi:hypothetical protein